MAADELIIVACPSCSQKYRVPEHRIGRRAVCKKCGLRFKIATDAPIDEDTLFGWVMEGDPGGESVMGSTSIFEGAPSEAKAPPPPAKPKPPDAPRVRFDRIDDIGAYFEFPSSKLSDRNLRMSFPHRCAHCLSKDRLNVHLLIWGDKLPRKDAISLREAEVKTIRSFSMLLGEFSNKWFDQLDEVDMLPSPFSLPLPYFVCHDCSSIGTVTSHILNHEGREFCQLAIANLSIAVDFYRNNGGRGAPAYQRLLLAARQQRDNQWSCLPFAVRAKISQWFTLTKDENFMGYFADSDFSRSEAGAAGLILTDRRMVYKKYVARREYDLTKGGKLEIEASKSAAMIEISQTGQRSAVLTASSMAAGSLAKSLKSLNLRWSIHAVTDGKKS